jgi:membrane-associated phospholipid phosphatase
VVAAPWGIQAYGRVRAPEENRKPQDRRVSCRSGNVLTTARAPASAEPSARTDLPARVARGVARHRWALATAVALTVIFAINGVPLEPTVLLIFGVALFGIDALSTKGLSETGRLFRDWAPLLAILLVYGTTNGFAESVGMPLQVEALFNADKLMFLGEVPTVWLQAHLVGTQIAWWEVILTLIYVSHFFASPGVLLWLYGRDRRRWRSFANRFLTLNAFGLATYILVPAAPPWWAAERSEIGHVARVLGRGWSVIGLETAGGIMTTGQQRVNEVAALPSLHAGYSFLLAMFLWRTARRSRWLLAIYPVAMGFTLVYGGEHYVIDILVGWLYAYGVMMLWDRIEARRAATTPTQPAQSIAEPIV